MVKDKEFYKKISKIGLERRWNEEHKKVKITNRLTKEKIAINAYICGDGWIKVRNEKNRKAVHYEIKIFPDNLKIAKRIVNLFRLEFNIEPQIRTKKNYFLVEIKNKPACLHLLSLGKYGGLDWTIPENLNDELSREWIKCFFDCEGYVNHYSGHIQVKSINHGGLLKIMEMLRRLGINSKVYGPYKQKLERHNKYSMLTIIRKKDLKIYKRLINFYHPLKKEKLSQII